MRSHISIQLICNISNIDGLTELLKHKIELIVQYFDHGFLLPLKNIFLSIDYSQFIFSEEVIAEINPAFLYKFSSD